MSLLAVLLVCLAIRPVLLVVAPLHELAHVAVDAGRHHEGLHAGRAIAACDHPAAHAPGLHRLMQRHGVIVIAEVPVAGPICAPAIERSVRFVCADVPVPIAHYAVPFRPPIA